MYKREGANREFEMEDACSMVSAIGFQGVEFEKKSSLAYSLSKGFNLDEMEDFDKYQ